MKLLASQDLLVYPGPSQSVIPTLRKKGKHPVLLLAEKFPGNWHHKVQYLPYVMKVMVSSKPDLDFNQEQLVNLSNEIKLIVSSLPEEFRSSFHQIIQELERANPITMDPPRAIEYLTMVGSRFVFDSIRRRDPSLPTVFFQGLTLPGRKRADRLETEVLIFHNVQNSSIDYLLIESLLLAVEKIRAVMSRRRMDLLGILKRKCDKFKPEGIDKRQFILPFRGRLKHRLRF